MTFKDRLKARRKHVKLSGTALGGRLVPPVSKQTISHWEKGTTIPDLEQITQLCEILRISADALILGVTGPPSEDAKFIGIRLDKIEDQDMKAIAAAEVVTVIQSHYRQYQGGWPSGDDPSRQQIAQSR